MRSLKLSKKLSAKNFSSRGTERRPWGAADPPLPPLSRAPFSPPSLSHPLPSTLSLCLAPSVKGDSHRGKNPRATIGSRARMRWKEYPLSIRRDDVDDAAPLLHPFAPSSPPPPPPLRGTRARTRAREIPDTMIRRRGPQLRRRRRRQRRRRPSSETERASFPVLNPLKSAGRFNCFAFST